MALKRYQETFGSVLANGDVFVLAGASVEVRDETSGALAAIFDDRAGNTAKANPFTTDANGYGFFYADDGRYRITATLSGETVDVRDFELGTGVSFFDTVSDMESATNLRVGNKVRTHGYNSVGDGGGNDYEIVAAGTGTADGGSYIDLSGSGMQARGLFPYGINPVQFGAVPSSTSFASRDSDTDSSGGFIAAVDYIIASGNKTLDLAGKTYSINAPIVPTNTSGVTSKRFTNGEIRVQSTFPGGYFFDFSGNAFVSGRTSFDNLRMLGGANGSMPEAEGMINLPPGGQGFLNTVVISHNELREFYGTCINGQAIAPATESSITNNRIKGSFTGGATNCVGIHWRSNDTEIIGNVIFNTEKNIVLDQGGISVLGNHLWNGQSGEPGRVNLEAYNARALVINDNYIDNGSVRLHDPRNTCVNSNKFVSRQDTIDQWNIDGEAHVVLLATQPNTVVRALSIQGNVFRQETPPTTAYDPFSVKSSGGGFDTSQLHQTYVKDNSFDELITPMTTHPRKVVSITASSSVNVDLEDIQFLNWDPIWLISVAYNGINTTNSLTGTTRSASVYTVNFTGGVSGNVILTASSNTNGE